MKKLTFLISILVFPIILYSQVYEDWSAPVALTDTQSYNANPAIVNIPEYENGDTFMFYEKKGSPEANRQIWWRRISDDMSDEHMFLGAWPEVDYRNPQVLYNNFLLFECNVFGNYDLFGVEFNETGIIGNTFQLTNTEYDENSLYTDISWNPTLCWESEGNILVANITQSQDTLILSDVEVIDSGDCYDPVCKYQYVAWQKLINNESHIYYSEKTYPLYQWSEPDTVYATDNNINLDISRSLFMEGWGICWENSDKIYFAESGGINPYISTPELPGIEKSFEPTAFNLVFIVDYLPELYSFAGEINNARDIYIVDQMFSSDPINITEDQYINKNPELFGGRVFSYFYEVIDIWQTEINGYDVLFKSQATYLIGDVKEQNSDNSFNMKFFPNPFHEKTMLSFYSSTNEAVEINIYDSFGKKHYETKINNVQHGLNEFTWNPDKDLATGLYYVEIRQGAKSEVTKAIQTKNFPR